jgi:transcriptional regulator with XRE-family HTH domain
MASIGTRLRELRQNRKLTLKKVAEDTGFALSYLSQLERDIVSISVDNLERLARYYEVHMVHFFRQDEVSPVLITRKQHIDNLAATEHGPAAVTLLGTRADARMEPLLIKISPGQEEPHFRSHDSDTLIYIIKGQALLVSETEESIELRTGDIAYYINSPRRRIINASKISALFAVVVTAPPASTLENLIDQSSQANHQSET